MNYSALHRVNPDYAEEGYLYIAKLIPEALVRHSPYAKAEGWFVLRHYGPDHYPVPWSFQFEAVELGHGVKTEEIVELYLLGKSENT